MLSNHNKIAKLENNNKRQLKTMAAVIPLGKNHTSEKLQVFQRTSMEIKNSLVLY